MFALDARAGWARVRDSLPAVIQITVTAAASYAFAFFVLGHQAPLIAAIMPISALGLAGDARPFRVLEAVLGMTLGIVLAELLLIGVGGGVLPYALALGLTLAIARFLSPTVQFTISAAIQCTLVMLVPPPDGGYFVRTIDAVVGGVFALLATALLPRDPWRTALRAGRRLVDAHILVLDDLVRALRTGDAEVAAGSLVRARAASSALDEWTTAVDSGVAIARVSPFVRRSRFLLGRQQQMLPPMDLATRNLRMIARRCDYLLGDGVPRPQIADLYVRIAHALGVLRDSLGDVTAAPLARHALLEIAKHDSPRVMMPGAGDSEHNALHATRPYLADLLQATGMSLTEARAALPPL